MRGQATHIEELLTENRQRNERAISLEFVLNDRALHHDHPIRYDRNGRWVLAGVIVAGYAPGTLGAVPPLGYAILSGFLGGAIILTTLKEELPNECHSSVAAPAQPEVCPINRCIR